MLLPAKRAVLPVECAAQCHAILQCMQCMHFMQRVLTSGTAVLETEKRAPSQKALSQPEGV
jgi:hypothetical protein